MFAHWFRSRRRRSSSNAARRLWLECLEDRTVPSTVTLPADTIGVPYSQPINAFYANQVVSYVPGTLLDPTYNNPAVALGGLNPVTGTFEGTSYYLTPFDPAFAPTDLVEVGAGGSLVLKLAETASTNGYTIGVHTGFGLLDTNYPAGLNSNPASYSNFFVRQADVLVSADGVNWGNLGTITFDNPSNLDTGAATDPEGLSPGVGPAANVAQPFLGNLSTFNGLNWQQTLAALNGSAGGTWLNLSGVTDENGNPITGVNYIKFVVPSNPPTDPNTGYPELMMVDAVVGTSSTAGETLTVSNVSNAIGGLNVPTTGTGSLAISGTPTATGTETFTVTASDGQGDTTSTNYSLTVNPAAVLSPAFLPADTVSVPYNQTITATGGTGTVSLSSFVTSAVAGLNVQANGTGSLAITGTPTASGTEAFTVTVTDDAGDIATTNYSITVNPAITLSPPRLQLDTVGVGSTQTISASGGTGAITLTVSNIIILNGIQDSIAGLNLPTSGIGSLIISGTPTESATETFQVTATDSLGSTTGPQAYFITVEPDSTLTLSTVPQSFGAVANPYGPVSIAAYGGTGSYTFTVASGSSLPPGLHLSSGGSLYGTPTASGNYAFFIMARDNDNLSGLTGTLLYHTTITPGLTISPTGLQPATVGIAFHAQLHAAGGSGTGYVFTESGIPDGLTLSPAGLISGTPTTSGAPIHFTVTLTDSNGVSRSFTESMKIDPALTLSPSLLPTAAVNDRFSTRLTATGGSGGFVFTASGLPAWLSISRSGVLSGTPTSTAGSRQFTVKVSDSDGGSISEVLLVTVDPAIAIAPGTIVNATVGENYEEQLLATGGSGSGYVFTATGLPTWLDLSPTGMLSGMPRSTTAHAITFKITVTDSDGDTGSHTFSLTIDARRGAGSP